jgi:hypothetical protein
MPFQSRPVQGGGEIVDVTHKSWSVESSSATRLFFNGSVRA